MMRRLVMFALSAPYFLWAPLSAAAPGQDKVVDVRGNPEASPPPTSFNALMAAYLRAHDSGDDVLAGRKMEEIRRLRVERNCESLDAVGTRLVARGIAHLKRSEVDKAEESFRQAAHLAPYLTEAHLGLARASLRRGPLGVWSALRSTVAGVVIPLRAASRQTRLVVALVPTLIVAIWAVLFVAGATFALRSARLLLHDLQETFGEERGRGLSLGVFVTLFALPAILFFGWGWLPVWWMALLFVYLIPRERFVVVLLVLLSATTSPLLGALSERLETLSDPLFRAALDVAEGEPDRRGTPIIEAARAASPGDAALPHLLASHLKRLGQYEAAAATYREILGARSGDTAASNNLANIEFAARQYAAAIARYKAAIETSPPASMAATLFYNLSLAHLQRFEYDAAREARAQAERNDGALVSRFGESWKYDNGDYAVVDVEFGREAILERLPKGSPEASQGLGRFTVAPLVLVAAGVGFWLWRGRRAFTLQCARCGVSFCRRCHLGTVVADLCTQCYHLFVVRDGVSGPARNQKLLDVQDHEARRNRTIRILDGILPGSGQVYGAQPWRGAFLLSLWIAPLAALGVSITYVPLTDLPSSLLPGWVPLLVILPFLGAWILAARMRPAFEVVLPSRRVGRRVSGTGGEA